MRSGVQWTVPEVGPDALDRAEDAARRAGVSVGEWLDHAIMTSNAARPSPYGDRPQAASAPSRSYGGASGAATPQSTIADLHRRLDAITSQINAAVAQQSGPSTRPPAPSWTAPPPARADDNLARAVAEITARQHELGGLVNRSAPVLAPQPAPTFQPDMTRLERDIARLSDDVAALRQSTLFDDAIATLRRELAEIRAALNDALPGRVLQSIESQIQALSQKISEGRANGSDPQALANVERALLETRDVLATLTPAEKLAGFDPAIAKLSERIETLLASQNGPQAFAQIDHAVGQLRGILDRIASADTVRELAVQVRALGDRIEQLTAQEPVGSAMFTALEQRIATLTSALEARHAPSFDPTALEQAVGALHARIDRLSDNTNAEALAALEARVSTVLSRLENASGLSHLDTVTQSLAATLHQLEQERARLNATQQREQESSPQLVHAIRDELADFRASHNETQRRTADTLEVVNVTLGKMVERLSTLEEDVRGLRLPEGRHRGTAPGDVAPAGDTRFRNAMAMAPQLSALVSAAEATMPATGRRDPYSLPTTAAPPLTPPSLFNPVEEGRSLLRSALGERDTGARKPNIEPPPAPAMDQPPPARAQPGRVTTPTMPSADRRSSSWPDIEPKWSAPSERPAPLVPDLPPDTPLEPGSHAGGADRLRPARERIAESEAALRDLDPATTPVQKPNFIAAARRAAQAASSVKPPSRGEALDGETHLATVEERPESSRIVRAIIAVLAGIIVLFAGYRLTQSWFLPDPVTSPAAVTGTAPAIPPASLEPKAEPAAPLSPTVPERHSARSPIPADDPAVVSQPAPQVNSAILAPAPLAEVAPTARPAEATGSVPAIPPASVPQPSPSDNPAPLAPARVPSLATLTVDDLAQASHIPELIGGPVLRVAAAKGDAAAMYEIGQRYLEGKRVASNPAEAVKWLSDSALLGVVPAMFRLGGLYEKGIGVTKDIDAAKRYYIGAAERGHAKAMHNLAVIYADGGTRAPDYRSAVQWFQKAAAHGIADSQYNLAVLYARGIGIEQNLAEAYKWFSLAAAQGDAEAVRKRDDIAKRLDAAVVAATDRAVQEFVPAHQPADALDVAQPAGGWDQSAAPVKPRAAKSRAPRSAKSTR